MSVLDRLLRNRTQDVAPTPRSRLYDRVMEPAFLVPTAPPPVTEHFPRPAEIVPASVQSALPAVAPRPVQFAPELVLHEVNFHAVLDAQQLPVVVVFYSPWCEATQRMGPALQSATRAFAGKYEFQRVDIDANERLRRRYRINAMPTLIIFQHGKDGARHRGAMSEQQLFGWLGGDWQPVQAHENAVAAEKTPLPFQAAASTRALGASVTHVDHVEGSSSWGVDPFDIVFERPLSTMSDRERALIQGMHALFECNVVDAAMFAACGKAIATSPLSKISFRWKGRPDPVAAQATVEGYIAGYNPYQAYAPFIDLILRHHASTSNSPLRAKLAEQIPHFD